MKIFIIITPGLEDIALREIEDKCPLTEYQVLKGGIEATVDHHWIHNAHHLLKVPTRIILRLAEFRVRDFPKLYSKLSALKWNEFLSHPTPHFNVTTSKSRLLHTGRIEDICQQVISELLVKKPLNQDYKKKNYSPQEFYLRVVDDLLTLSVDLSGEPLYKRGEGVIKGEAPLRESIASALLYDIFNGVEKELLLFDPMCGSGTFLYEGMSFYNPSRRPFAYTENPLFKGKHFAIPKLDKKLPISEVLGHEINEELVQKLNRDYIKVQDSLLGNFTIKSPSLIICNPPYGERIQIQGKRGHFLKEALAHLFTFKPQRLGWLVPTDMEEIFHAPTSYKLLGKRRFRNGGLMVSFISWEIIP